MRGPGREFESDFKSMDPGEFVEKYEAGELEQEAVIDVREKLEWDYYHLEKSTLIPMNAIPGKLGELPADRTLYIICAHGVRSAAVCGYLRRQGLDNIVNVEGGMAAVASLRGFQYD